MSANFENFSFREINKNNCTPYNRNVRHLLLKKMNFEDLQVRMPSTCIGPSFNCSPQIFTIFDSVSELCGTIMTGPTFIRRKFEIFIQDSTTYSLPHSFITRSTW